ncbi:MAG: hypothetical protein ACYDAO_04330 [Thermoplasmataceae archaeon]
MELKPEETCKNGHPLIYDNQLKIKGCQRNECGYSIHAIVNLMAKAKGLARPETPQQIVINSSPPRIEISTNAKGQHQWVISKNGDDLKDVLAEIINIDDLLMEKYKSERGSA